jgi:hypothetical protein
MNGILNEWHTRASAFENAEFLPTHTDDSDYLYWKAVVAQSQPFERAAVVLNDGVRWLCRHTGTDFAHTLDTKVCPAIAKMVVSEPGRDFWWRLLVNGGTDFNVEAEFNSPLSSALKRQPQPSDVPGAESPEKARYETKVTEVLAAWMTKRGSALRGIVNIIEDGRNAVRLLQGLCMDDQGLTMDVGARREEVVVIVQRLMKAMVLHDRVLRKYPAIDADYGLSTKNAVNVLRYTCGLAMTWPFSEVRMAGGSRPYSDQAFGAQGLARSPWVIAPPRPAPRAAPSAAPNPDPIEVDTDDEAPRPDSPSYAPIDPSYRPTSPSYSPTSPS